MDIALVFALADERPQQLSAQHTRFAGPMLPVMIPVDWINPQQLGRWSLADEQLALAQRVRFGLAAGLETEVWSLLRVTLRGQAPDAHVQMALALWAAQEQSRLGLPSAQDGVIVIGDNSRRRIHRGVASTYGELRSFFDGLSWPRWSGPLVVVVAAENTAAVPASVLRPALPIIHIQLPAQQDLARGAAGAPLARLILASIAPPEAGWPSWFAIGMEAVANARSRGDGPSPLAGLRQRQQAGLGALRIALNSTQANAEHAEGIANILMSGRRRQNLGNLVDLLRNGVGSEEAIRIAYGLTLEDLLIER